MLKSLIYTLVFIISLPIYALPIDWNGSISLDTLRIDNFNLGNSVSGTGSQGIAQGNAIGTTGLIQTYTFQLKPHMIINDGLSLKGIFSSGNIQGESFGSNTQFSNTNSDAGLHYHGTTAGNSELDVSQLFLEIYADSALYRVGRFSRHWGLGAIANDGKTGDRRFFTAYDGFEAEYNFGKFYVTPFWSKQYNGASYTRNTQITELGAKFLYDNPDKDMKMGVLYTKRESGGGNNFLKAKSVDNGGTHNIGSSSYKLFDIFIQKNINKFEIKAEIPMVSGQAGNIYDTSTASTYKAQAFLIDLNYKKSVQKNYGVLFGQVSGDDAMTAEFEGMFLHPNYKIAHFLFNYNLNAIGASSDNVFQSYVTNTMFAKLYAQFVNENWTWNFAYIFAKANEVAKSGQSYYFHEGRYKVTTANGSQDDNLGHEFDVSFDYQWNPNLTLTGFIGYFMTGDYYKFSNNGTAQETKNAYTSGLKMLVNF